MGVKVEAAYLCKMWDERYSEEEYAYGAEPNDFLKAVIRETSSGVALCLAEGQGRNAVYLARLGFQVTAMDLSEVGLRRATELARVRGVSIRTEKGDMSTYPIPAESCDLIVSIFGHAMPEIRTRILREAMKGLRKGGLLVLEGYSKEQLPNPTGGPKIPEMLYSVEELREDIGPEAELLLLQRASREIHEGRYHNGMSEVVQLLARKR